MVYIVLTAKTRSNVRNFRSFETNFLLGETSFIAPTQERIGAVWLLSFFVPYYI